MRIAVHSGSFHADDAYGAMVLVFCHPERDCEIIRTRDHQTILTADAAVDVGGISDPDTLRFDHHQKGFSEARTSGVVYASAGLVWKVFGPKFVALYSKNIGAQFEVSEDIAISIAHQIDNEFVQYLDMADTGAANSAPGFFGASSELALMNISLVDAEILKLQNPTSEAYAAAMHDLGLSRFKMAMEKLQSSLCNMIRHKISEHLAAKIVRSSDIIENGCIMVLDTPGLEWESVVQNEFPDVLFVVYPDSSDNQYQLKTVTLHSGTYANRKALPRAWAGLRDGALAVASGVEDAVFCHNGVFIAGARSKDGAIKLAKLALLA